MKSLHSQTVLEDRWDLFFFFFDCGRHGYTLAGGLHGNQPFPQQCPNSGFLNHVEALPQTVTVPGMFTILPRQHTHTKQFDQIRTQASMLHNYTL